MIPFKSEKQREIIPEGSYAARVYQIVQIGQVPNTFPGSEYPTVPKLRITWELDETREFDGEQKPLVIGGKYTISLGDKSNLRPIVEGILGKLDEEDMETFDMKSLLGKTCMISILHKTSKATGKEYAVVVSTAALPKKMEAPAPFNEQVYLDYHEGWSQETFDKLPEWIKKEMWESVEMKEKGGAAKSDFEYPKDEIDPNDVPF